MSINVEHRVSPVLLGLLNYVNGQERARQQNAMLVAELKRRKQEQQSAQMMQAAQMGLGMLNKYSDRAFATQQAKEENDTRWQQQLKMYDLSSADARSRQDAAYKQALDLEGIRSTNDTAERKAAIAEQAKFSKQQREDDYEDRLKFYAETNPEYAAQKKIQELDAKITAARTDRSLDEGNWYDTDKTGLAVSKRDQIIAEYERQKKALAPQLPKRMQEFSLADLEYGKPDIYGNYDVMNKRTGQVQYRKPEKAPGKEAADPYAPGSAAFTAVWNELSTQDDWGSLSKPQRSKRVAAALAERRDAYEYYQESRRNPDILNDDTPPAPSWSLPNLLPQLGPAGPILGAQLAGNLGPSGTPTNGPSSTGIPNAMAHVQRVAEVGLEQGIDSDQFNMLFMQLTPEEQQAVFDSYGDRIK